MHSRFCFFVYGMAALVTGATFSIAGCQPDLYGVFGDGGGAGAGGESTGSSSSGMGACRISADCGESSTCETYACDAGVCSVTYANQGIPCNDKGGTACNGVGLCAKCDPNEANTISLLTGGVNNKTIELLHLTDGGSTIIPVGSTPDKQDAAVLPVCVTVESGDDLVILVDGTVGSDFTVSVTYTAVLDTMASFNCYNSQDFSGGSNPTQNDLLGHFVDAPLATLPVGISPAVFGPNCGASESAYLRLHAK